MIRPVATIAEQIAEFEAMMPQDYAPPADDFAATVQWSSWQNHLSELRQELREAEEKENAA